MKTGKVYSRGWETSRAGKGAASWVGSVPSPEGSELLRRDERRVEAIQQTSLLLLGAK